MRASRSAAGRLSLLQAGDGPGQGRPLARQHRADRRTIGRQIHIARANQLIDHAGQAESLSVLRGEDRDPRFGEPRDLVGDDHPATATEDPNMPRPGVAQRTGEIFEVLDMPALIGADRHALHVFLDHGGDHFMHRTVVTEMNHLRPLRLKDAPHDVDRRIVPSNRAAEVTNRTGWMGV